MFRLSQKKSKIISSIFGIFFALSIFYLPSLSTNQRTTGLISVLNTGPDTAYAANNILDWLVNKKLDAEAAVKEMSIGTKILEGIFWIVQGIDTVCSWVLMAASALYEVVVYYTIIKLSTFIQPNAWVTDLWIRIRDVCNMFFIFMLLYIGIMTIIQPLTRQSFDWSKRTLLVIVTALLINFSMPLVKATIDLSDITAYQFYKKMKKDPTSSEILKFDIAKTETFDTSNFVVSSIIQSKEKVYNNIEKTFGKAVSSGIGIVLLLLDIILVLVLIYGISVGTSLLLIRFVTILILVMVSPLPFLFWNSDKTAVYAHRYMQELAKSFVIVPTYMACLYITLYTATRLPGILSGSGATGAAGGLGSIFSTSVYAAAAPSGAGETLLVLVIGYLVPAAMMIGSVFIAKAVGGLSGDMGISAAKKFAAYGTVGAAAYVGSRVGGRLLNSGLGQAADRMTGGRISQFSEKAASVTNAGLAKVGVGAMASTANQRADATKAQEKAKVETRVAALKNMVKAQGLEDKGKEAEHAKVIDSLNDPKVQKAYYQSLDDKTKKAVDPKLATSTKGNLMSLRTAQVKDNPQEIADYLKGLKDDELIEFYTDPNKMKEHQKAQVEQYLVANGVAEKLDAALPFNQRKAGKMAALEGDTAKQIEYMKSKLATNEADRKLFFTGLEHEDSAKILAKLESSGDPNDVNLASQLRDTLGKKADAKVTGLKDKELTLATLKNPNADPAQIKSALSELSDDELAKDTTLWLNEKVLQNTDEKMLGSIAKKVNDRKKVLINQQIIATSNAPGSKIDPMFVAWIMTHDNWKDLNA